MATQEWADRLIAKLPPEVREALAGAPAAALKRHFGLETRPTRQPPSRGEGGWCDGLSILEDRLILYVPAQTPRRDNFTLLHEFGHFLAREDEDFLVWVADQPETARVIEAVCDRVAAGLLLPKALVEDVLAGQSPAARHIQELYQRSQASREACIVALSRYLGTEGFIALIERDPTRVRFAARSVDTRPYAWRGDPLPPGHPLRALRAEDSLRQQGWWPRPSGDRRGYWMDAVADDRYTYAIFAARDLWQSPGLHVIEEAELEAPRGYSAAVRCPSCGFRGTTSSYPCGACHRPYCPQCKRCECDRQKALTVTCSECRIGHPRHLVRDGMCEPCRRRLSRRGAARHP